MITLFKDTLPTFLIKSNLPENLDKPVGDAQSAEKKGSLAWGIERVRAEKVWNAGFEVCVCVCVP